MRKVETRIFRLGMNPEVKIAEYLTKVHAMEMIHLTRRWGIGIESCKLLPKGA